LAEDSLINQKLAIGLLEKWGHRVMIANDGSEAVSLSARNEFDLILMDVQMPDMDGLDATRAIRHREEMSGSHVPIVAMTAHAMKGDRERCLEAGMDDYLMKPIRADQLFQAIERYATGAAPSLQPEQAAESAESTSGDHVDWTIARRAVNDDEELLNQVALAFLEECPQLIHTMQASMPAQEWRDFQRAAHTLKSGLRMFGAQTLANDVERLELSAKSEDRLPEPAMVERVTRRCRELMEEMTLTLHSMPGNGSID
jgi:CheY-like chemotaxis protein/HPt (histidine-containing phosphotransfer) domain-containing protein